MNSLAALAIGALLLGPASPASPAPQEPAAVAPEPAPTPAAPAASDVIDELLPSGVRIRVAQDKSLPVAALVLAVEVGSKDDPAALPGLVHVLSFLVLQGNRELAPHGAAGLVNDSGGVGYMAFGPGQVRYESLVPLSILDEMLLVESHRLRAPTVTEGTWMDAISDARRDPARRGGAPPAFLVAAFGEPSLGHPPRAVDKAVAALVHRSATVELAKRLRYASATLAVVSPEPPEAVAKILRGHFADLEPRARTSTAPAPGPAAAEVVVPRERGDQLVLSIAGTNEAREAARVLCRGYNRQRTGPGESRKTSVRCNFIDDPRRPIMVLRASGAPAGARRELIDARTARLIGGSDAGLLDAQRQVVARQFERAVATPLGRARVLATDPPSTPSSGQTPASLQSAAALRQAIASHIDVQKAVHLLGAQKPEAKP